MKLFKKWRLALLTIGSCVGLMVAVQAQAAVPDISEWQGQLSSTQVQSLKNQANFVINRVQYGSGYEDIHHVNNENLYVRYGVPFGSYDFATFTSASGAVQEAKDFYNRANKNTRFYVLDFETTSMSSSATNAAVKAWYDEMRKLTNKHLIFYSYQSFATSYANTARQSFDAQWIANYSSRPTIPFSLWQYSSSYYLSSLNQYVDNNLFDQATVTTYHPLSWWLNENTTKYAYSSYGAGQHVYLHKGATNYYGGAGIPSNVKQKYYKIGAVQKVTTSSSKQIVYLKGLDKWVLAQDVTGYWVGQHGSYTLRKKSKLYSDINLKHATGTVMPKGATYAGTLVKDGNYYRIRLNGGYITGKISKTNHAYYESVPSSKKIIPKKNVYTYRKHSFKKADRVARHKKGKAIKTVAVYKRSTGSRYYMTNKGNFFTANKAYVKTK
ncbi:GH25 family lysozyme [Lactiplantibacillus xiangfangensis]|uniref:GH25 family lysozyme n=1 Tax=Lactiplantibacillus xiangfangensis TaxID=942150 RepID=UPI00070E3DF8|nr:GH25 family lysozyme [Lactiplantibacillus xiangfangensis]